MLPSKNLFKHREEFVSSFDKLFDSLVKNSYPELTKSFGVDFFEKSSYPKMNVAVVDEGVEIVAEIPGLTKEDVKIKFIDNVLTISGDKKETFNSDEHKTYIMKELKQSSFSRSLRFHQAIKSEKIDATFKDGVLTIFAPWETPSKGPKELEIKIK